jgi:GNAT superfamily N-acetyltransferase
MPPGIVVTVRLAKQEDLDETCSIDYEAFSPYGTAEIPSIIKARWEVFPQGFVIAENKGYIIGYGTSEKWRYKHEPVMDENPFKSHYTDGRFFCITAMAVRRDWQGLGVGSLILETLIQIAKNEECQAILLETTHAQSFYFKRGFHAIGKREQMKTTLSILVLDL